jgi:DNA-binding transcriptional ArsR family regulator
VKTENGQLETPKRRPETSHGYEGSQDDLVRALAQPFRRQILRALHEVGEARSPNELSKILSVPVGHVSYHVKVLRECGALVLTDTRPVRGAMEHFYASTVAENDLVTSVLGLTGEDDEAPRGAGSTKTT